MTKQKKNYFHKSRVVEYFSMIAVWLFLVIVIPTLGYGLTISFTSQAPIGDWSQPYADACEESSIVMVDGYYNNRTLTSEKADYEIRKFLGIKNKYIGPSLDEDAAEIAKLINNYLNWEATVVENPTLEKMKEQLDKKQPIILPADGAALKNPNFTGTVDYHVIVVSGYDDEKQEFITQDPGTSHGHDFRYSYQTIQSAIHDYVPGKKISAGPAKVVFTSKKIDASANTDGDADGLVKQDEIKNHTSLVESDTDRDGFSDKEEVESGYSPLANEKVLKAGDLVRSGTTKRVYLLGEKEKFHIKSAAAFAREKFTWKKVVTVSDKFLSEFRDGAAIK